MKAKTEIQNIEAKHTPVKSIASKSRNDKLIPLGPRFKTQQIFTNPSYKYQNQGSIPSPNGQSGQSRKTGITTVNNMPSVNMK